MDLLNLAAKIELDDSQYTKGVNNAERLGKELQGKMSAMTVAVGNLAADMIRKGAQAVTSIISGAIDGYADYQQLVGGVETLFKGSAKKVQEYAAQSYKTTGLSANKYMETVTSFSASLLQGLGGNTEVAADLANTAITDMADNANKMGTDISSIQSAYQGFAKQNYTMLDNLKLGYGGTKEEMVRLINDSGILDKKIKNLDGITFDQLVMAIHEIQTQMGITGTTAAEAAETISGSKASLAAAWQDLLTQVGGAGDQQTLDQSMENFKTSFTTYMENFIPTLVTTITNSGSLVNAIAESIGSLPTTLLSEVGEAGLESGTEMVGGISKITHWLISSIANLFTSASADPDQIKELGEAIGSFIGTAISDIVTNAPAILQGIIDVGISLAGGLVQGLFEGLFGTDAEVDEITKALQDGLTDIDLKNAKASAILSYMDTLIEKYGEAASETDEWKQAQADLEEVLPGAGQVFVDYGKDIGGAVDSLKAMNEELRKASIENALLQASAAENALLAEQTLTYNKAKTRRDTNQGYQDSYIQNIKAGIQEAAGAEAKRMWDASHDENGNVTNPFWNDQTYQDLLDLQNGFVNFGDGLQALEEIDFSQLENILNNLGADDGVLAMFATNKQAYQDAQKEIDAAQKTMDETQKEIDATKAAIAETDVALQQTLKDLLGGQSRVGQSLNGFADVVDAITGRVESSGGGGSGTGEATGIDYVPYDGFHAELHRGERVVTAKENQRTGGSADLSGLGNTITNAIRAGMQNVQIPAYLDGQAITDDINRRNMKAIKDRRYSL